MNLSQKLKPALTHDERDLLHHLRQHKPARAKPVAHKKSLGESTADLIASVAGSWRFIIVQSLVLLAWIALNLTAWIQSWDPYPFILLNLVLSFQAAYAAPIILMSQNRQAAIDRGRAEADYRINAKAELEIELLHEKVDLLREQELLRLTQMLEALQTRLAELLPSSTAPAPPPR